MECKSLQELNLEFQTEAQQVIAAKQRRQPQQPEKFKVTLSKIFEEPKLKKSSKLTKRRKSVLGVISDILFYLVLLAIIVTILTCGQKNDGSSRTFMGYSYFTVLTTSMQSELPKGSFILVKYAEPYELEIGDNITFMRDASTSITHKIIGIYENYDNSGMRGFQTKGVNNPNPDKDIVFGENIIGKVIFTLPNAGTTISYLAENIYIVYIILGLLVIFSILIRGILTKPAKRNYRSV